MTTCVERNQLLTRNRDYDRLEPVLRDKAILRCRNRAYLLTSLETSPERKQYTRQSHSCDSGIGRGDTVVSPIKKCFRGHYGVSRKKQWVVIPFVRASDGVSSTFNELSAKWRDEIGCDSSLTNILGNINYLKVIALGWEAVPLMLEELKHEPAPWFTALCAITGENPVPPGSAGDFAKMAFAWLKWGREHGLLDG